jgi:hypothetical protein
MGKISKIFHPGLASRALPYETPCSEVLKRILNLVFKIISAANCRQNRKTKRIENIALAPTPAVHHWLTSLGLGLLFH